MRSTRHAALVPLLALALVPGCAVQGPGTGGGAAPPPLLGSPFSDRRVGRAGGEPLLIDRTDLRIGTTVQFRRLPTESEIHDLSQEPALLRVVIALPGWPESFEPLEPLNRLPGDADVVVVLAGYPPSRAASEVWNYLGTRLRIVVVAEGPPPHAGVVADLNTMRGLERLVVDQATPSRAGLERLQRPIAFRRLIE